MLFFENDYTEGAHEEVLKRLWETNREPLPGYGTDIYCESAREKIREACACPGAEVHFLVGGTQTNAVVIAAMLRDCEGVIAASTGHVSLHEAGAVEYTGHKVLEFPHREGKLEARTVREFLRKFWEDENRDHMVFPGMVYISHPTEYGTLYTAEELEALAGVCREYDIPLYMDGARLGYGLAAEGTDVTLPLIAGCCDAFYIGGTKVGALCGEAVVFTGRHAPSRFMTVTKRHGALLAKGRLLGVQFDALFTDGLYMKLGAHAIRMAALLRQAFQRRGYEFFIDSPTNQQFVILDDDQLKRLGKQVSFSFWERLEDGRNVVRFAVSWATEEKEIEELDALL